MATALEVVDPSGLYMLQYLGEGVGVGLGLELGRGVGVRVRVEPGGRGVGAGDGDGVGGGRPVRAVHVAIPWGGGWSWARA